MLDGIVAARNGLECFVYTNIAKQIFFRIDPEIVHDRMIAVGARLGRHAWTRKATSLLFSYSHPALEQDILGIHFFNPIGLSAGFDKDAELTDILPSVGFGFAEVGSVTGEPCEGNPKPRLWRLPKSKGLVVHYGLKSKGCEAIAQKLRGKTFGIPIGMSIAKTNCRETTETNSGIRDYVKAYRALSDIGAFSTINISCPNAYGGQPFTDPASLDTLLAAIDEIPKRKPIFLKLSPDLSEMEIDAIIDVCARHSVDGFICTNLTKNRDNKKIADRNAPEKGGLSGKVVQDLSDNLIRAVWKKTGAPACAGRRYVIIGCGGVFSAEDAYKKIKAGASLIQLITGMIFEGPQVVSEINRGLVSLLKKDGFPNISQAVGADYH